MTHSNSKSFDKEIFLAVIGTTPQVLTECLYFYSHPHYGNQRTFSQIKVLTTSTGKQELVRTLFNEKQLEKLEVKLGEKPGFFKFTKTDIIVFTDKAGNELPDLLSSEDNDIARDCITAAVRDFTEASDSRLTATVAGGRKTMSALMALSYQLYARESDELVHIIPHDSRMSDKLWFFPGNNTDADQQLWVSEVPTIRVGRYLAKDLSLSVEALTIRIQDSLQELSPVKSLQIKGNSFTIDGETSFTLPPREAALYRYLLRERKNSACADTCSGCVHCNFSNLQLFEAFKTGIITELEVINGWLNEKTKRATKRWRDLVENRDGIKEAEILDKKKSDLISEIKSSLFTAMERLSIPLRRKEELMPKNSRTRPVNVHIGLGHEVIHFLD